MPTSGEILRDGVLLENQRVLWERCGGNFHKIRWRYRVTFVLFRITMLPGSASARFLCSLAKVFAMSRFFSAALAFFALGVALMIGSPAKGEDKLAAGDKLVFLGDSITQAGAGPDGYIKIFETELAKQHPSTKVDVIGAGISGNRVPDLEGRLERDVLAKKPTAVVIYIGINDVWHSQNGRGTSKEDFEKGLRRIIAKLKDAKAKVFLCTASVIGEKHDGSNPLDKMLDEYCAISRAVAADTKVRLIDLRKAFVDHLKANNNANADKNILTTDGVHLNKQGNQFVAEQMLTGLTGGAGDRVLRHVVLFQFKEDTSPEKLKEILDGFKALPSKIPEIADFECGTNNSPEGLADGLTHAFIVTFKDEKGRATYLPHAEHLKFVDLVKPHLKKAVVVDFWTK